jgi:3-oxoacyl-[acyl-carrier protein] reductase
VDKEPFFEIDHYRLPALDQTQRDANIQGVFYDATALLQVSELKEVYEFFHGIMRFIPPHARIVIVAADGQDQLAPEARAVSRALEGFARSLAKEVGRKGATVQLLALGSGRDARQRLGAVMQFFLSDHAAFITGQKIAINSRTKGQIEPPLAGSLAGKVALVTGAAQGIGLAIARSLAAEGAHLLVLDRPENEDTLQSLAQELEGHAIARALGIKDSSNHIVTDIAAHVNHVDLVIHNAGVTRDRTLKKMSKEDWDLVLQINLQAVIDLNEALLERNILAAGGRIVCLSSISGIAGNFGQTNYSSAKAGLIGYAEGLSRELARQGITVNAVAPGFIETPMTGKMPFVMRQFARRMATLAQGGQPQDVADLICFLASPGALGISGQVLRVCGGHLMGA